MCLATHQLLGKRIGRQYHPCSSATSRRCPLAEKITLLLEKMNLVCGRADLEDGLEGLREEGADALEAG